MYERENPPRPYSEVLPTHTEKLYEEARDILDDAAIKPIDFVGLYGIPNVEADIAYVEEKETQFATQETPEAASSKKMATIFEGLVHVYGSRGHWFGPHSTMLKASKFDDIKHGVDSIVEFKPPNQPASQLALAIDVTFAKDLQRKFDRIRKEIEEGKLTKIKYFDSKKTGFKGMKTKVPRVVVGANIAIVKSLADLWSSKREDLLVNHPIQNLVLQEMIIQCEAFARHAEKSDQREIADIYKQDLALLRSIYASKPNRNLLLAEEDQVFQSIKGFSDWL